MPVGRADIRTPPTRNLLDGNHLQILARIDDRFDGSLRRGDLAHQRLDVDDALAFLAGDLGPVVRVRRVGQIFVFFELLAHARRQIIGGQALRRADDATLEGEFLRALHHRLDHRARAFPCRRRRR